MEPLDKRRVCVIGAGSSGIVAIRECLEAGLDVVCFERAPEIGGAWIFEKEPGPCQITFDDDGLARASLPGEDSFKAVPKSPMYEGLRTNVPSTLMAFRGRPFEKSVSLFPDADTVEGYLLKQAEPVRPYIHLSTMVTSLRYARPDDGPSQRKWLVETRRTNDLSAASKHDTFDFIVVANGHYTKPWIPFIRGLDQWHGEVHHSRWFRNAETYSDKTVLVVGNSASGYDIARMLALQVDERRKENPDQSLPRIYQSSRSKSAIGIDFSAPGAPDWAAHVHSVPEISQVDSHTIRMTDGEVLTDVDIIIFATGYLYSFPFADQTSAPFDKYPLTVPPPLGDGESSTPSRIAEGGLRIHHLDQRQLFYLPDPTLCILAVNTLTIPFPLAEAQSKVAAAYWSGQAPNLTFREGVPETHAEDGKVHVHGAAREHDYQDGILAEIGCATDGDGVWDKASVAQRELRAACKGLRRAVLGY